MSSVRARLVILHAVFLLSGFAAIIYQLIWQRALLTSYGANSETVTVVVAAFMLGLGAGSLAGGELSQRSRWSLPALFAAMELGIAVCGVASLPVFAAVSRWTLTVSPVVSAVTVFLLLLVPTALMGATLPMLVAYTARYSAAVGRAVGSLYSINALGSALGAGAAIVIVFSSLGQQRSVWLAASLNIVIALVAGSVAKWGGEGVAS
ncbi:MAG: hypothetical protein EPO35_11650 [Acidobacteria bacterium]|nr:MAG: hypothetical protein EPO35_11650 [Acidobacteriota bacterium]